MATEGLPRRPTSTDSVLTAVRGVLEETEIFLSLTELRCSPPSLQNKSTFVMRYCSIKERVFVATLAAPCLHHR